MARTQLSFAVMLLVIAVSSRASAGGSSDVATWLHSLGIAVQNSSKGANTQLPAIISYQYDDIKATSIYQTDVYLSWSGLESWSTPPPESQGSLSEFGPVLAFESHATTQPSAPQNNLSVSAGAHWDPTWQQKMQSLVIKATGTYENNSTKHQSDIGAVLDIRPKQLKWIAGDTTVGLGNTVSHFAGTANFIDFYIEPFVTGFFGKTLKTSAAPVEAMYHTRLDGGLAFSAIGYPASDSRDLTLRFDASLDETWLANAEAAQAATIFSYQLQFGLGFGKLVTLGVQWKHNYAAPSFAETKQVTLNIGLKI